MEEEKLGIQIRDWFIKYGIDIIMTLIIAIPVTLLASYVLTDLIPTFIMTTMWGTSASIDQIKNIGGIMGTASKATISVIDILNFFTRKNTYVILITVKFAIIFLTKNFKNK